MRDLKKSYETYGNFHDLYWHYNRTTDLHAFIQNNRTSVKVHKMYSHLNYSDSCRLLQREKGSNGTTTQP